MASIRSMPVNVTAGQITRTYLCRGEGGKVYTLQLSHNTVSGDRVLSLDGVEIAGTAGRTSIMSSRTTLSFEAAGKSGALHIDTSGMSFFYSTVFDGVELPEENTVLSNSTLDETLNRLKIVVEKGEVGFDEDGGQVAWFAIHTVRESDQRATIVHRRYRDFAAANDELRAAYKGSHLLSSFPPMPGRSWKLWEDHFSKEFIERRRWQLQDYLVKVSQIPRMRANPDFLTFLGIIDNVREVSVLFPAGVTMGISLTQGSEFVEIVAVKPLPTGEYSPAQRSGVVNPGDKVSKINGEGVLGRAFTHDLVMSKIKAASPGSKPVMIHFLGQFKPIVRPDDAEVAPPPAPEPAPVEEPPPPPRAAPPAPSEAEPITGLIGEGVAYAGTGATPKPQGYKARGAVPSRMEQGSKDGLVGVL